MNEIKIYLKPSGSIAELYKDFELYEGCYRNSQLTVFVPKSLLYENENGTFVNLAKTGAILTAPNGSKLTTKSYYLDYERDQTIGGVEFRVYTTITPKEFCVYAGTQTVVVNVESIDNTNPDAQTIISVTTTQTADLIVLESAYLGQDEPIDPTELDKIKATLTEIQSEIGGLPNKYVPRSSGRHIVYVNDINGNPSTQIYAVDASGNIIVQRDENGQIKVPLAPLQGYDATSKNYVDESIEALPSKYVTLDTDQTIDGTKGFTSPITVGGQTWRTSYMKDSFVYTVDGYSYEVTYPEKSGLMALKSDIPTDYATQGQLAQTNQNVEDLYTILEQAQVVTVTTLEQAYTTRETADGENIVDGVQTTVKEIRGKTVATENLIPYPYEESTKTANGVTFTVNSDGSVTVNGTATARTVFFIVNINKFLRLSQGVSYRLSGCPAGGGDNTFSLTVQDITYSQTFNDVGNGESVVTRFTDYYAFITIFADYTANNLIFRPMLNAGTTAKPYSKGFAGLKNASFEKIVSTGRNLIPYPYEESTKTANGVTFTVNSDGSVTVNGTATARTVFFIVNINKFLRLSQGVSYRLSGCPAGGGDNTFSLTVQDITYSQTFNDVGNGESVVTRFTDYYAFITIFADYTANNLIFRPMLNIGTTALPYEPYISDTLSAETPIELAEYDVVYPETGETKRQSNTLTFDGTEEWYLTGNAENNFYNYRYYTHISVEAQKTKVPCICNKYDYKLSVENDTGNDIGILVIRGYVYIRLGSGSTIKSATEWKSQLAAWAGAGNPLTVTYKTAEATTEATPFNKSKYIAWKNGSETIEQGPTDNSEYGAENTVKQDYFTLTGGTTNG